jgi:hypothetical protein
MAHSHSAPLRVRCKCSNSRRCQNELDSESCLHGCNICPRWPGGSTSSYAAAGARMASGLNTRHVLPGAGALQNADDGNSSNDESDDEREEERGEVPGEEHEEVQDDF